jgi:hypothetical protein
MIYACCTELRRNQVVAPDLNGIHYLEVLDGDATNPADRQRVLFVHFIKDLAGFVLTAANIRIEGGERIRNIGVESIAVGTGVAAKVLTVHVDKVGDFSPYTLRLITAANNAEPPEKIDPMFAAVDFSFKVECPADLDCKPQCDCPPTVLPSPEIDYLAKDYASFRRLMLDRISFLVPNWQERHAADIGIALVEVLAYVGDHLSYQQDAIVTEAYLRTARRRVSVRRHAKLVDYTMHDGCNARAWVQVQVKANGVSLPAKQLLCTRVPGESPVIPDEPAVLSRAQEFFETMEVAVLYEAHNEMRFYTWGDQQCRLPQGAIRATLSDTFPDLKIGDVLIIEEVIGPSTGAAADADPSKRWAVRLTSVQTKDARNAMLVDPLTQQPITQIAWGDADALPFAFCISCKTDSAHGSKYLENVSVMYGNIVLADHGRTLNDEEIGTVPATSVVEKVVAGCDPCDRVRSAPLKHRFRPVLARAPLTFAVPYLHPTSLPASEVVRFGPRAALPSVTLTSKLGNAGKVSWPPVADLLSSKSTDTSFVVETENDGRALIRFGDGKTMGQSPEPGTKFTATYRIGNGSSGNVGADSIVRIVSNSQPIRDVVKAIRNPISAAGGVDPESMEQVRSYAPAAFRTQQRAVTEEDYAAVAERHPEVQSARATFRWTGSWRTVFISIDRVGDLLVDKEFKQKIRDFVERFRMAGYDLEIDAPKFVSLKIKLLVCVKPGYFRENVKAVLLKIFSDHLLPSGQRGMFHPDNFTFGQTVFLSPLIAAAQAVEGVQSVTALTFERQGEPESHSLSVGKLEMGRLEIARCANDRNFVERGIFELTMGGGK